LRAGVALRYFQRLNTLHVDLGPDWRGGQSQALLLINGLRDRGHAAKLIAPESSPLAERARTDAIRVYGIGRSAIRLRAAYEIARLLARESFDVVHCHEAHGLTAAWLAGAHRHTVLIASRRVAFPVSSSRLGAARYRSADRIAAVSQFVRERTIESGLGANRVEVVYDGVPTGPMPTTEERLAARMSWGIGQEPLIGCIGKLVPQKGQEFLIRALPLIRVQFPDCRLLLAGDGPCRNRLARLSASLGVENAVLFAGFVNDVTRVYRTLDVFAFPAIGEALGSSLLAAMSHGLPAVGLRSGAVPEIIEHGKNGLLAQTAEPEALAAALVCALRDRGPGSRLGAAARQTVEDRFSAARMVENTISLYAGARAGRQFGA
jgi:glycosyltransferase involved in cell wall biosynthesis